VGFLIDYNASRFCTDFPDELMITNDRFRRMLIGRFDALIDTLNRIDFSIALLDNNNTNENPDD
jgi:hypothetical protein